MQTFCRKLVVFASLVTLAGCGSSGGGGVTPVALGDFASEYAKAFCHHVYMCCDATELADAATYGSTEAECVSIGTAQFAYITTRLQPGIDGGRIVYHGDRARRCMDNVGALSCSWGVGFNARNVPDCQHFADGTVANGAACTLDEECMSGFCSGSACAARVAVGDACTAPTGCADGLYCPVSAGDHCVAVAHIGAACEVSIACENNSCVIPDGQTSGTCGAPMMCNGI
jgi:hypothetical protein